MASEKFPRLGRALLADRAVGDEELLVPDMSQLDLPERVVQFGTGAFLRGFVEYWVDEANRLGMFGGRIVAVSSTDGGSARDARLTEQDGLYTLVTRGVENGKVVEEQRVVGSLSRALSARRQWSDVLALARSPQIELVVSNTTEIGIALDETDEFGADPPRSFPGKLTRFLYERARAFGFDASKGVVVLPCELIERNGDALSDIVLELSRRWDLGAQFARWVEGSVKFCNTLVDRIVPGFPSREETTKLEARLGFHDDLLTTAEPYRLFAIEADETLGARIGFARLPGVAITDDVGPYRERKVRLLNGSHTIMVPTALLCGCETVGEAMKHDLVSTFLRRVMFDEIVPTVHAPGADSFANEVLDRFANPFIRHSLWDIALQGTMKMRVRVVPSIVRYVDANLRAPASLAFGLASHLLLMRGDLARARSARGMPVPEDTQGERLTALWNDLPAGSNADAPSLMALARRACADRSLWGTDLSALVSGFSDMVGEHLVRAIRHGTPAALEAHLSAWTVA
jgi:tagaturonate reductase